MLSASTCSRCSSFKCRGAYNKMANLSARRLARGVIASSPAISSRGGACRPEARLRAVIHASTTPNQGRCGQARGAEVHLHATPTMKRTSRRSAWLRRKLGFVTPTRPGRDRWPGTIGMESAPDRASDPTPYRAYRRRRTRLPASPPTSGLRPRSRSSASSRWTPTPWRFMKAGRRVVLDQWVFSPMASP